MPDNPLPLFVCIASLIGVAIGRLPYLRMNRATIAVVGAVAVVVTGGLSLQEAFAAIDLSTLALLLAMMIVNAHLRIAGVFDVLALRFGVAGRSPRRMLVATVLVAGVGSALLLNDTVVLVMTPLVLEVCAASALPPVPFLVALGAAANVGSAATVVGNPQNILIGSASGIPFREFSARLGPPALLGLLIIIVVISWIYRRALADSTPGIAASAPRTRGRSRRTQRPLRVKCAIAISLMVIAMLAGVPVTVAALGAAAALLISRRVRPERVLRDVDFSLLVFFAGLFVVTHAFERTVAARAFFAAAEPLAREGVGGITLVGALLSNLVSNVPAVLLLRPVVGTLADPHTAWLTLAIATTFAGNLTLLGSVANLIVAESARRRGVELSFVEYLKAGVPITIITLVVAWLWLR